MLTTVQDLGRWGFQSRGVPVAGPMDAYAHRLANALVGNAAGDAALEVTLIGPELQCDDERVVAVTGARFDVAVDGRPVSTDTPVRVAPGARLKFGRRIAGARAYLAVSGGIDTPPVFGSRATHLTSAMGGFEGRALRAGDRVAVGPAKAGPYREHGPAKAGHYVQHQRVVRILPGPHSDYFPAEALPQLQAAPYTVGSQSDRMGFRLDGGRIATTRAEMISDATPMGGIQVPASGQPIVLMADRQTAGGYPMIATVITADLPIVGQLAPGDAVAFVVCTPAEAIAALIGRERELMAVERRERA